MTPARLLPPSNPPAALLCQGLQAGLLTWPKYPCSVTTAVLLLLQSHQRNRCFLEQSSCCPSAFVGCLSGLAPPGDACSRLQGAGSSTAPSALVLCPSLPALAISGCEGRCRPVLLNGGRRCGLDLSHLRPIPLSLTVWGPKDHWRGPQVRGW